jgi:hypothetical protein
MKLAISNRVRAGLLAFVMAIFGTAAVVAIPGVAQASSNTCTILNLAPPSGLQFSITPHMTVPVCYNGSTIWQNGPVTGGVNTIGYYVNSIDWKGTYNSGGTWLGVGENITVSTWLNFASFYCPTRWQVSAKGNVFSYTRGC